jgi:hypothetical protein
MSDLKQNNEEAYVVPNQLPDPPGTINSSPSLAIVFGLLVSVVLGVVFFVATRFMYIYILYNWLLGVAIGQAIGFGLKRGRYTNINTLTKVSALCSYTSIYLVW